MDASGKTYTLAELEQLTGVSARTIRFYISKGLLPSATMAGRTAAYSQRHLDLLQRITDLKNQGLTLDAVRLQMEEHGEVDPTLPPAQACLVINAAPDVTVMVRADLTPWRRHKIDRALVEFVRAVTPEDPGGSPEGE